MTLCADDSEERENGVGVRNTSSHRPRRICVEEARPLGPSRTVLEACDY